MKTRSLIIAACIAAVLMLYQPQSSAASTCDARCWYVKYKQEQRKTKRLRWQLKSVRSGRNKLQREIIPWVRLSLCESGGRWHIATGNGFYGGLQFHPGTWRAFGGTTFARTANKATAIQQAAIAQKVLRAQGRNAWPGCTRKGAW